MTALGADTPAPRPSTPASAEPEAAPRARARRAWPHLLGLAAVAAAVVVLHVLGFVRLSLIDEIQHTDSLYRAARWELVRAGDRIGGETIDEVARRRAVAADTIGAIHNTAYVHPPTYYVVTAQAARAVKAVLGLDSLVTAGRLVGAAWLAAALALGWAAAGHLGAPPAARWGALLLLVSSPPVLHFSATVNPDGAALLVGAAVLLAVLRFEAGRSGLPTLAAVALLAAAIKLTHLLVVGAAALYLLARAVRRSGAGSGQTDAGGPAVTGPDAVAPHRLDGGASGEGTRSWGWTVARRQVAAAAVLLGVGLATTATWAVVVGALAEADVATLPMTEAARAESFQAQWLVDGLTAMVTPTGPGSGFVPAEFADLRLLPFASVLDWLVFGAIVGALLYARAGERTRTLGAALGAAMILGGPLFVVANYFFQQAHFRPQDRYGLSLALPLAAVVAACSARRRVARAVLGLGLLALAATLAVLATPAAV